MKQIILGQVFTRRDIAALFGGNARAFLPRTSGGEVVAGCFDPAMNPRAPSEVLVHNAPNAIIAAKQFVLQSRRCNVSKGLLVEGDEALTSRRCVPVFIKLEPNVWEYTGHFRAAGYITDPVEVAARIYEIRPRIYERHVREYGEIRGILLLEEA